MIYIVHGEDNSSSRNFLLNLQSQNNLLNRIEFDLSDIEINSVVESKLAIDLNSIDMFGESKLLILNVTGMGRTNVDPIIDFLSVSKSPFMFVIFSGKELSKANPFIKNSSKFGAKVLEFKKKPSSNIFNFVDAVFSKNRKQSYKELQKLLIDGEDAVYLITMLSYGLRSVAYAKFNSPLFNKIPPFNKPKVKSMAEKFTEDSLKDIYELFYDMDKGIKFGEYDPKVVIPLAVEKVLTY